MKKIITLILALIMMLVFASCGSVKGEQKTWGNISVFVPEKYSLNGGSLANDNDKNQCTIKPEQSTNMYDYFIVAITNAKNALSNIASTKSVNNAEDVTVKVGDTEWKGCKYLYDSVSGKIDCGMIYAEIGDVTYQVSFCGHAPESEEMNAILASLATAK